MRLPVGKVPPDLLRQVLKDLPRDSSVVRGPGIGDDSAVCAVPPGRFVVATSDPITFASGDLARYALRVNANDIYVTGGAPAYFLVTVLLPEGATDRDVREIFSRLADAAREVPVSVVGGHTEVVRGLPSTILSGHMIGFVESDSLVRNETAQAGDVLLVCGEVAVEGTAIMAHAAPVACRAVLGEAGARRARSLLDEPGICVGSAAEVLFAAVRPRACHDPTDGGVLGAVAELAEAAGTGVVLRREDVPILPECRRLCTAFGLDPLRLIASGALLCAVRPGDVSVVLEAFRRRGMTAAAVGELVPVDAARTIVETGGRRPFPGSVQDAIVRFWKDVVPREGSAASADSAGTVP